MSTSETLTFEGLTDTNTVNPDVPSYGGFHWKNLGAIGKGVNPGDPDGYHAVTHGHACGFSAGAADVTLKSHTRFSLDEGHFASAWNVGLTVTFTAYRDGHSVGSRTFILDQVDTLITFHSTFKHIDRVVITHSGGTDGTGVGGGPEFGFDNLKVAFYGAIPNAQHDDHAAIADMLNAHHVAPNLGAHDCFC